MFDRFGNLEHFGRFWSIDPLLNLLIYLPLRSHSQIPLFPQPIGLFSLRFSAEIAYFRVPEPYRLRIGSRFGWNRPYNRYGRLEVGWTGILTDSSGGNRGFHRRPTDLLREHENARFGGKTWWKSPNWMGKWWKWAMGTQRKVDQQV